MGPHRTIISVHVDGYYGLVEGVPNILNLLDKYNLKASFFVTLGRESNLLDIIRLRKGNEKTKTATNILSRYTFFQKMNIALLNRKIGCGHREIMQEIEKRGHELNPHCGKHLQWSNNFEHMDKEEELRKMRTCFLKLMGHAPAGFAPPVWKWDEKVIEALKNNEFKYICIKSAVKEPFFDKGFLLLPISFDNTPEELLLEGLKEDEILEIYKKEVKKDYAHLYFHADFEGIRGMGLLEKIFSLMSGERTVTCNEVHDIMMKKS